MGPGNSLKLMEKNYVLMERYSFSDIANALITSFVISLILTFVTYYVSQKREGKGITLEKKNKLKSGATNIIFICLSMTVMMLLVNDNLMWSFAIGACLKVIQLRADLTFKKLTANLFFAIVVGIACGVQYEDVAWIVTAIYVLAEFYMLALMSKDSDLGPGV